METNDHVNITTASSETRFNIETSLLDNLSGARDSASSIPGVSETSFNVEASLLDDLGRSCDSEVHPAETMTASASLAETRFNIGTSLHMLLDDSFC